MCGPSGSSLIAKNPWKVALHGSTLHGSIRVQLAMPRLRRRLVTMARAPPAARRAAKRNIAPTSMPVRGSWIGVITGGGVGASAATANGMMVAVSWLFARFVSGVVVPTVAVFGTPIPGSLLRAPTL